MMILWLASILSLIVSITANVVVAGCDGCVVYDCMRARVILGGIGQT
jgi:hypothetical protein